ncbi:hypothetical protein DAPPUDRAFT_330020 [Daphnia pulex]|uniref:Dynein axonemal assembly factor 11-like CS domain-containing protein n=1 Tax=Daphnia pulex TaxID=6669 RepID=E9HIB4_DAPPU|nr:hypothetical protein DAPPUDRAFT_330020 [Daphnia pulex]|eukprot:EFX68522.1 hypothetical protein DAPPUDRAFT_330020 [Daphnia pulex]
MSQPTSITRELIRKRAEHNEGVIFSLEEIALHQQNICKIEHIDLWCPSLKIIYLQANEISKIENVRRFKNLEYLNLALNKIEIVENLEGCESLNKLDLTLNCIRKLSSLTSLTNNYALREIYLTGNPCAAFKFYRLYVIGTLPQLESLDGVAVLHTERLAAKANFDYIQSEILEQEYIKTHNPPIERASEIRRQLRNERECLATADQTPSKPEINRLVSKDGRVLNSNQAEVNFKLVEEDDTIILTVKLAKYMDTSLIDVDVQPTFVRVIIKGKLLQLVLSTEVQSDRSVAQRSLASGDLVVTMPMVKDVVKPRDNSDIPALEPIA